MFNIGQNEVWTGECYETRQEAIEIGRAEAFAENKINTEHGFDIKAIELFEVGQVGKVTASGVNVDSILEDIAENTGDELGEVAEDYLNDVTKEDSDELEEKLNEVLYTWMKKRGYEPNFWAMQNIEELSV
jgi:hypothetical protein